MSFNQLVVEASIVHRIHINQHLISLDKTALHPVIIKNNTLDNIQLRSKLHLLVRTNCCSVFMLCYVNQTVQAAVIVSSNAVSAHVTISLSIKYGITEPQSLILCTVHFPDLLTQQRKTKVLVPCHTLYTIFLLEIAAAKIYWKISAMCIVNSKRLCEGLIFIGYNH